MDFCDTFKILKLNCRIEKFAPAELIENFQKLFESVYLKKRQFFLSVDIDNLKFYYVKDVSIVNDYFKKLNGLISVEEYSLPEINYHLLIAFQMVYEQNTPYASLFFVPNERLSRLIQMEG